jgi:hypothetical protein
MIAIRISVFHLDFQSGPQLIADEAEILRLKSHRQVVRLPANSAKRAVKKYKADG